MKKLEGIFFLGIVSMFFKKTNSYDLYLNVIFSNFKISTLGRLKFAFYNNLTIGISMFQFYFKVINNLMFSLILKVFLLNNF